MDTALREFAEAPPAFVPRSPEEVVVRDPRFFLASRPILEHFGFERTCTVYVLKGEP